jgi:lipoprotein-anchoring transpeptidase ErfK/SrfK
MSGLHLFRTSIALSLLALCTSCAELENATKAATNAARTSAAALRPRSAYWNAHGVSGRPKIVVRLIDQRAYFYRGKTVIGESSISTGRKGYETPPGKYRIIQKDEHHVSSIYGDFVGEDGRIVKANVSARKDHAPSGTQFVGARMPYFLRFTRGYGMHAGFVPRYRASHGCIRMPAEMAKHFFDAAELNTPVIVKE